MRKRLLARRRVVIISCTVFLYRGHVEGIAFKTDDRQSFRRKSIDDLLERILFPRIGQSRKIGIDFYNDFRNPHLETEPP